MLIANQMLGAQETLAQILLVSFFIVVFLLCFTKPTYSLCNLTNQVTVEALWIFLA